MPMGEDPNRRGGSRRWIVQAVEDSLRRLGTDWIDLYQVHRPDPDIDVDETLGALTDLVQQGKVRYIGSSSYSGGEIVEAQWTARERRPASASAPSSRPTRCSTRGIELDVLPTAQRHGMGILTYSPLGGGWLSGSWSADSSPTSPARQRLAARFDMSLPENQRKLEAVEQLAEVADDAGVSMIELAIAFVVNHPAVTSAIIGPRTMEQLESQLPAADVALDAATLDRIDEIVRPGVNLNPADTNVVAQGGGGVVESRLDSAEPRAQVLRQTSLVERASQIGYLRRRHDVGDVVDPRPGTGEALLDALGRQADGFDQLDRAAAAGAEGGVVNELRRLTAREDVLQRHALDRGRTARRRVGRPGDSRSPRCPRRRRRNGAARRAAV